MVTEDQLEYQRSLLAGLLHDLTANLVGSEMELLAAPGTDALVTAVGKTVEKLAEASAGWEAMLRTIRNS